MKMSYIVYNNLMAEEKQNTGTEVVFQGENHVFLLRRLEPQNTSFVRVDFSPLTQPQKLPSHPHIDFIHPSFNRDCHYYTPAFILPLDQQRTQKHQDAYLKLHEERRCQISQEREQLLVPKPSKSNSFCCICKVPFEDYLTHLNLPHHQQLLEASPFRGEIVSLTQKFNAECEYREKEKVAGKNRRIRKCGRKAKLISKIQSYLSSTTLCNSNSFEQKPLVV